MIITAPVAPAVTITSSTSASCNGVPVSFTATVANAGTNPSYQWKRNGANTGGNSPNYTSGTLNNGDVITVTVTGSGNCISTTPVTSNAITVNILSVVTPSVSITTGATTICQGQQATFTATPVNGGTTPSYQWKRNSINTGTNSNSFTTTSLASGDVITVVLTSNAPCVTAPTANSNSISMLVNTPVAPAISISGLVQIDEGQVTVLNASVTNGGSAPLLQWQDSTATHNWQNINGASLPTLSYYPEATGDKVRCVLTSNAICVDPVNITSGWLVFSVRLIPRIPNGIYGILYYPNPATSILTVDSLKLADQWQTLEIISINGKQKLLSVNVANRTKVTLNILQLARGTYIGILRRRSGDAAHFKFVRM